jgi:hypothetical protein
MSFGIAQKLLFHFSSVERPRMKLISSFFSCVNFLLSVLRHDDNFILAGVIPQNKEENEKTEKSTLME